MGCRGEAVAGRCQLGSPSDLGARLGLLVALACIAALLLPTAASAATELPATITEDMTLTVAGSPYTGTTTIASGVTLTVEPGVRFEINQMDVKGTLKAEGSAEEPIVFTGAKEATAGEWCRIGFEPGSGASVIDHAEVKYAGGCGDGGVVINGSSPTVENSVFEYNASFAIHVTEGGSPEIANNRLLENHNYNIYYKAKETQTGTINIHGNEVEGGESGIWVESTSSGEVFGKNLGANTVTNTTGTAFFYEGADIPGEITSNTLSGNKENIIKIGGTVGHSETWSNGGTKVKVSGSIMVASGVTLTITKGVFFKNPNMTVKGTLKAEGTAEEPVIFAGAAEKANNEWCSIAFEPGSGASVIEHAELKNAGNCGKGVVAINGSSPTIRHSTFRGDSFYAIKAKEGGAPEIAENVVIEGGSGISYMASGTQKGEVNIHGNTIEGGGLGGIVVEITSTGEVIGKTLGSNTVRGATETALYYEGTDIPGDVTGNALSGNKEDVIRLRGTVAHSETWTDGGTPVKILVGVTVASAATLTIGEGVLLKNPNMTVKGTLKAEGTAEEPVIFAGAAEKANNEWCSIAFEPGSGASVIEHAELKNAGNCGKGVVAINGSSPTIRNSTFRGDSFYAIKAKEGGSPEIAENVVTEGGSGIFYSAASKQTGEVNIHGNVISGGGLGGIVVEITSTGEVIGKTLGSNLVTGATETALLYHGTDIPGDVTDNTLFENKEDVIRLGGTVAHSETWTDGGGPIKFDSTVTVAGGATLTIDQGVFLKNPNTEVKGTLKAEGTSKEPVIFTSAKEEGEHWCRFNFLSGSGASVLDYVEVRYGGGCNAGAVGVKGPSPTIKHSTFSNSYGYAIKVTESGSPTIEWNRFRDNASGLSYSGEGKLAAPNNDWGCSSGPTPAGCGDSVTSNIDWEPAIQLEELAGHCRGESQCGKGADPVSLATGQLAYSHRDLLLTNKSEMPLEFSRSYSSGSEADTGLGPGWAQSGLASASEQEDGDVLVVRSDGRQDLFEATESGYVAPSGVTDVLSKTEAGTFELTTLQNTVYAFDSSGRIAQITDDHGLKTTYGYNASGRLATITDPSAQTLTFTYNASNHITAVKDSTGREVKYAYSIAGDLESVTDALGGVTKYAYDSSHRMTSITDPKGNVILKNTYDSQGRIAKQLDGLEDPWELEYNEGETIVTEPEGGELKYGFDAQDRVVSETDQLGHKMTTAYDAAGNVSEVLQPGGAKWIFGHDAAGNLTSVKDPEGGEREYEYDGQNRVTAFTDARGATWHYDWSEAGDLTKITDPEERATTLAYNEVGQPLSFTDPAEHESKFSYDTRGNRLSVTDPLGHETSYEYNSRNYLVGTTLPGQEAAESLERNALGDVLSATRPEGRTTKYAYDANGLPTQITDPAEGVWKIAYNAMERPTLYEDPLEGKTEISYDGNLRQSEVTNKRGKTTTFGYDAANQLTSVKAPEGEDWSYGYDARGNRDALVDPREHETTYGYDLLNRMTEAAEPLEVTSKYAYDAGGDLTSVTDPRGYATLYAYDDLGRLTDVYQPLEETSEYSYDAAGNLASKTTAAGTLSYEHDAASRLTAILSGETALRSYGYDEANRLTSATDAESHEIEVGYDEDGLPTTIEDGRGQSIARTYNSRGLLTKQEDGRGTVSYEYDKLGRATSIVDPQEEALSFAYDPEGDLASVERPNGVTTTNVYNDAGRLAETTSEDEAETVLEALEYAYDPAGNVTSKVDARTEEETTYAYDALNRIAEFNPPGEGSTAYGYDKAGNRTEAGSTTYSFNALNRLTEASDGTTYSYDGAGRMTGMANGEDETTYAWDPFDHLAKAEGPSGSASYAYDALERLSERKGEETQVFHYGDLGDRPTYDANGEGKAITSYLSGPSGLLEQRSEEATSFPLSDAHGDVTAIVGPTGTVESRQSYDPWGGRLSGPSLEMGYLGAYERLTDPTTGLIQMGARSYSPELGAFMSEDPVFGRMGIGISANRYPYVWDNPLNLYDLNGRKLCLPTVIGDDVCPTEAAERFGSSLRELAERTPMWKYGEQQVDTARWLSDRASDFWKERNGAAIAVAKFIAGNWEYCQQGAEAGAPGGAVIGSFFGPEGTVSGGAIGGAIGCVGLVGEATILETL